MFALHTKREGNLNGKPAKQVSYFHNDHLGSLAVISNEAGAVIERLAYDPWGKRRYTDGNKDNNDTLSSANTKRGYTMHEHMDEMGVINMNGRVYDPAIGRFLTADPHIQSPGDLQSFNRYSYVSNNPLAYTHPTGYFSFKKFFRAVVAIVVAVIIVVYVMPAIFAAAAGSAAGGAALAATTGAKLLTGAIAGGLSSAVQAGSGKAFWRGALTGALFAGAGAVGAAQGQYGAAHFAAHAGAGCISAVAGGGNCGRGAASALVGKFVTGLTDGIGGDDLSGHIMKGAMASVAGGLASVAGGGKFEDGATTAAFGYLFNQVLTGRALARLASRGAEFMREHIVKGGGVEIADKLYLRHNGVVSVADGVYQTGDRSVLIGEVKLGNGGYTSNQKVVYPHIDSGRVEIFGANAPTVAAALNVRPDADGKYYLPKGTNFQAYSFSRSGDYNASRSQTLQNAIKSGIGPKGFDY